MTKQKGDIIVRNANDYDANLPVGANGEILTADSSTDSGVDWKANSGIDFFSTTQASGYGDLSLFTPDWGSNTSIVLESLGSGSLLRNDPDGTATGGNARGTDSVDLQSDRAAATEVASGNTSVVAGGSNNTAGGVSSVTGGGSDNDAQAQNSTVAGGSHNTAISNYGAIGGGVYNSTGATSTVAGGSNCQATGTYGFVGGGTYNTAVANYSTIGGGSYNDIPTGFDYSTIGGGQTNEIGSDWSFIGGGLSNTTSGDYSTVGGGQNNTASESHSAITGGLSNTASGTASTVGGGEYNSAEETYSTVAGGSSNVASGLNSTVAGGLNTASGDYSTVGGGLSNTASGDYSSVGGGANNTASDNSTFAIGKRSVADKIGQSTHASGRFAVDGDAQSSHFVLRGVSTSTTAVVLTTDGTGTPSATNQIVLKNNQTYSFHGTIVARQQAQYSNIAAWYFEGIVSRGTSAAQTAVTSNLNLISNSPAWSGITVTFDQTFGGVKFSWVGATTTNIRVVAEVTTAEVTYT